MARKITLTIIAFFVCIIAAGAQVGAGVCKVKGNLIDSTSRKPVEFITISIKHADGQDLNSQQSRADGTFLVDKLPYGKFRISFFSVGYTKKSIEVSLNAENPVVDLGPIFISPSNTQLKAVAVTAARQVVKQEADRLIYDLQADPDSKSSNVLEMMRKVPLLTVDAEDNVKLSGNTSYRIFINGKPSSMMERSPKEVLKSMPASTIQKIEVITTPSSKYDAEGIGGIINIITNKTIDNGYNANLNLNERFPLGGPSVGGSFSTKSGRFGLSVFGGASSAITPTTWITKSRQSDDAAPSDLFQTADRRSDSQNAYLGTELSYELDTLNLISGQFNLNGSTGTGDFFQNSILRKNSAILQQYDLSTGNNNTGRGADAAMNYQRGFHRHKSQLLTISYRYYGFVDNQRTDQLFTNRNSYDLPDFRQVNQSIMNEHTAQLDYVYPLNLITVEVGVKGIFRTNESDFQYLTNTAAGYAVDPSRTNTFNNTQTILAAYNSYQYKFKDWTVNAGIRFENTVVEADFVHAAASVNQNYFSIVPSVSLGKRFKNSGINFGWNQRIQRPGINQLNPFIDRSNPVFQNTGNPDLKPTKGDQVRIGYDWNKKGNLNISLKYSWIRGLIFQVSNYDEPTGITLTRFENTGGAKALGGNINFSYPLSANWNVALNGSLAHGWADGISNGKPIRNQGYMYNFNLSSGLQLNKGWRLSGNAYLNGGELTVQQNSNAFLSTAFSVSKDVVKEKLSFSAFVNNPFDRYRMNVTNMFGPNFEQVNHSQQNFRTMGASLSYRFGKMKESIKKNKRGISNDDVSN